MSAIDRATTESVAARDRVELWLHDNPDPEQVLDALRKLRTAELALRVARGTLAAHYRGDLSEEADDPPELAELEQGLLID